MDLLRATTRPLLAIFAVLKAIVLLVAQIVFFFASIVAVKVAARMRGPAPS